MMMKEDHYEEGDKCPQEGCSGVLDWYDDPDISCSCHICAPCSKCTDSRLCCTECGEEVEDLEEDKWDTPQGKSAVSFLKEWMKPKELDNSKIDYYSRSHTHFSMIKEGVYPKGTTQEEVYKEVAGSFGGRFESFSEGKFKFIAYTD
jgi:hypothetical protein